MTRRLLPAKARSGVRLEAAALSLGASPCTQRAACEPRVCRPLGGAWELALA